MHKAQPVVDTDVQAPLQDLEGAAIQYADPLQETQGREMSPARLERDWPEKTGRAGKPTVEAKVGSAGLPEERPLISVNELAQRADTGHGDAH